MFKGAAMFEIQNKVATQNSDEPSFNRSNTAWSRSVRSIETRLVTILGDHFVLNFKLRGTLKIFIV